MIECDDDGQVVHAIFETRVNEAGDRFPSLLEIISFIVSEHNVVWSDGKGEDVATYKDRHRICAMWLGERTFREARTPEE